MKTSQKAERKGGGKESKAPEERKPGRREKKEPDPKKDQTSRTTKQKLRIMDKPGMK